MTTLTSRGRRWVVAAVAMALALRLPFDTRPFYDVDEAVFALGARAIGEGGLVYRDVWDHRGPLLHHVYAAIFTLFGSGGPSSMVPVHLVTTGAIAVQTVLLYRLVAPCLGVPTALATAFLFTFFSSFGSTPSGALGANAEIWTNLFVVAGLVLLAPGRRGGHAGRDLAAGLCLGLAGLTKQIAYAVCPIVLLAGLLVTGGESPERRPLAPAEPRLARLALGALAPLAGVAAYYWWRGALGDFADLFLGYNLHYLGAFYAAGGGGSAASVLARAAAGVGQSVVTLFSPRFTLGLYALVVVAMLAALRAALRRPWRILGEAPAALWFFCAWWWLTAVPTVLLGRAFPHYFVLMLPAASVLAAWTLVRGATAAELRPAARLVLAIVVGSLLAQSVNRQATDVLRDVQYERLPGSTRDVAAYIAARTRPEEPIFVWGLNTDLYVRANRPPASRFVFVSFLTGWTPGGARPADAGAGRDARAIDLWRDDLARSRPRFIIDGHRTHEWSWPYPLTRFPAVWGLVEAEYRVSRTVGLFVVYERTTP